MVGWRTIALLIIPLVALFLLGTWVVGGIGGLKKTANDTVSFYTPEIKIGADKLKATPAKVPAEHKKAIEKLADTIQKMVASKDKPNCFMNYQVRDYGGSGLPTLGEEGTILSLAQDQILVYSKSGKTNQIDVDLTKQLKEKMKGFKPCVIAGKPTSGESIPKVFSTQVLKKDFDTYRGQSYYLPLTDTLLIFYDSDDKRNSIKYKSRYEKKEQSADLEDRGWLYKTNDGHICFFPTTRATISKTSVLNDQQFYIDRTSSLHEKDNIPYLLSEGKIDLCSGKFKIYTIEYEENDNRFNLKWQITETEKGIKSKCLWSSSCGYDKNKKDILGYWLENENQKKLAAVIAKAKKWSDITSYPLPADEKILITSTSGKTLNLNELTGPR